MLEQKPHEGPRHGSDRGRPGRLGRGGQSARELLDSSVAGRRGGVAEEGRGGHPGDPVTASGRGTIGGLGAEMWSDRSEKVTCC